MRFLHRRGVKGCVTFNTLVFTNELGEAEDYLRTIILSGVDAAIVQDIGICRMIRVLSPDFPIHCSTQMTISSAAGVFCWPAECTYRAALDRVIGAPATRPDFSDFNYGLEMAFSRGLATGWFQGINNKELVHARFGTKRGVFLGTVSRVERDRVIVRLEGPVKPGDGVVFDQGRHEEGEQGGRVYHDHPEGRTGCLGLTPNELPRFSGDRRITQ